MKALDAHRRRNRHSRRASVYLLVLGICLLVTVIGLSSLLAAQVEQRSVGITEETVKADFAAQTLLDLAFFSFINNPNWRSGYTNDTWLSWGAIGGANCSVKLVDELDGDLVNDGTQAARLYGRATLGDAVRIYSVCVEPRTPTNLVSNGDFESGTTGWTATACVIEARTDGPPHGGTQCVYARNRTAVFSGCSQSIASFLKCNVTYRVDAWVKLDSGTSTAQATIGLLASDSGVDYYSGSNVAVGTTWTKLSQTITPYWEGTLIAAKVYVTTANTTAFRVDDVVMYLPDDVLATVPGTYRREVLPPPPAPEEAPAIKGVVALLGPESEPRPAGSGHLASEPRPGREAGQNDATAGRPNLRQPFIHQQGQ